MKTNMGQRNGENEVQFDEEKILFSSDFFDTSSFFNYYNFVCTFW